MRPEHAYYQVAPRLLAADSEAEIVIAPRFDHCRFPPGQAYVVQHVLMEDSPHAAKSAQAGTYTVTPDTAGCLRFTSRFPGEQEHWLRVVPATPAAGGAPPPELHFKVYSLRPDLFARRPWKGDLHLHSTRSDGRECPAYVAAAGRRIGLDFLAITDHGRYAPSLEARAAFAGVDTDLRLFPGEEVHPPDEPVHMINFGARQSVNDLFKTPEFHSEVEALTRKLAPECPPAVDPYQAAACVWTLERIRALGGLAIFCHPHWVWRCSYNVAPALNDWLFQRAPFDAFELIGGFYRHETESNQLQVAWYHEQSSRRPRVPVVGSSDAHGVERGELFGWYYTLVFAPSLEFADLAESIRGQYSVAIEALPGETPRAHGSYRLVKYALFLLREILPQHDELCVEEGRLLLAHVAGEPEAAAAVARLKGRCARLYESLWQR